MIGWRKASNVFKKQFEFAKSSRRKPTYGEHLLWKAIRRDSLGVRFKRQIVIHGFVVDFYCHKLRLGVEADGRHHERDVQKEYDKERDDILLHKYGVGIVRISNDRIIDDIENVVQDLHTLIDSLLELRNYG